MITILGLGPGHPHHLTREAWEILSTATEIWTRTARHPTLTTGMPPTLKINSFDSTYDSADKFEDVYKQIVSRVLELAAHGDVIYCVPGHPAVGESTVEQIRTRAAELNLAVRVVNGLSFIEPSLLALKIDALPNLFVCDALDLATRHHPSFSPDAPVLIAQLYSAALATDVKLTLMNQYDDEQQVALVHAVGTPEEKVEWLSLYEIDRSPHIAHLTSLYIPAIERAGSFQTFENTIAHLRAPEGCPWDREQTHQTLRTNLLEETYEALAAIDAEDPAMLREELGDLLLQIVLQTQIAVDEGEFRMKDVIGDINAKLIRRHPHVFGDLELKDAEAVIKNWEKLKAQERANKPEKKKDGLLSGVPKILPALSLAQTYQERAARVGFDWPDVSGVLDKVREEIVEIQKATTDEERAAELGDLFFVLVNFARWHKVDAESALRGTCEKFAKRFGYIEAHAQAQGRELKSLTLAEMDALWTEAKKL